MYRPGRAYVRRRTVGSGAYRVRKYSRRAPTRRAAPRRRYTRGRGRYKLPGFNARKLGTALGSMGGMAIGNMIAPGIGGELGSKAGSALGEALGRGFRALTGWGDYAVAQNSLLYPDKVVPSFGPDTIRVRKREFITNIVASTDFSNFTFSVNPGLDDTFPWLSNLAHSYEQYRWNGLIFEYVSQSAVAISATNQISLGTVCLAADYNAIDAPYINMPQMLSTMFSNSGRPSDNIMMAVECAPTDTPNKLYYVRSGDQPSGSDLRLYDMLSFQVGVDGLPSGTEDQNIGQLWANYDVTFCKSVQNTQVGFDLNTDHYIMVAPSTSAYFGTSQTLKEGSGLGTTVTTTELRFPPSLESGFYLMIYAVTGASTANVAPTITAGQINSVATVAAKQVWVNDTASFRSNGGSTSTSLIVMQIFEILHRDAFVVFSVGTLPGTPTFGDLIITQVNGEIYDQAS